MAIAPEDADKGQKPILALWDDGPPANRTVDCDHASNVLSEGSEFEYDSHLRRHTVTHLVVLPRKKAAANTVEAMDTYYWFSNTRLRIPTGLHREVVELGMLSTRLSTIGMPRKVEASKRGVLLTFQSPFRTRLFRVIS